MMTGKPECITIREDVSGSRALDTVYQNKTDRAIWVAVACHGSAAALVQAKTDAANPPTTAVFGCTAAISQIMTLVFPVLPGEYYAVSRSPNTGQVLDLWNEWR